MKRQKKIAVWDGIFQGIKYITEEESEARLKLIKENNKKMWKFAGWVIIGCVVFFALFISFIYLMFS